MKKALVFFGELDDQDLDWIVLHGRKESIATGKCLIEEGRSLAALYVVLEGLFAVTVAALKGEEVGRLGAGEVVGEISFVDRLAPSGTVRALAPSTVFTIPASALTTKLKQDLGFASRFYRALAVMLAFRLRRASVHKIGAPSLDSDPPDELDESVLDKIHLAGARFERMLKRVLTP